MVLGALGLWESRFCFYSAANTHFSIVFSPHLTSHLHPCKPSSSQRFYNRRSLSYSSCPPNDPSLGAVVWYVVLLPLPYPWNSSADDRNHYCRHQQSTGRGGAGNFRSPSCDRAVSGPDDYSDTRGREPIPTIDPDMVNMGFPGTADPL